MLFDLRGRRRWAVKIIYLSLALLMGGGLILFGIGGNSNVGGLFDAFQNESEQTSGDRRLKQQIESIDKQIRITPKNPELYRKLTKLNYQLAGLSGFGDTTESKKLPKKAQVRLVQAANAWKSYLALNPKKPDSIVALQMVQAFGPIGLDNKEEAVKAMEVVVEGRPTAAYYGQLAILAYEANQNRKADLASKKAIELAPKSERAAYKAQLDQAKNAAAQKAVQEIQKNSGNPQTSPAKSP